MEKDPDAFRTISEVAEDLDLPQHVLRFWETRFTQIRPLKRGGGRRYYRPDDADLLRGIRQYLYGEGYTIKGVQRILKERGLRHVIEVGRASSENFAPPVATIPRADANSAEAGMAPEQADWLDDALGRDEAPPELSPAPYAAESVAVPPSPDARPAAAVPLSAEASRRLQVVMYDLLECKRTLDAAG